MSESGWTVDTLRDHFEREIAALLVSREHEFEMLRHHINGENKGTANLIAEIDKRYQFGFSAAKDAVMTAFEAQKVLVSAQLQAGNLAVAKAEMAYEKRFDNVNEFRATLSDQQRTLMPRAEAENRIGALAERLDELQKRAERAEGRHIGGANMWGYIVAGISVMVLIITFISGIWSKVETNTAFRHAQEAQSK